MLLSWIYQISLLILLSCTQQTSSKLLIKLWLPQGQLLVTIINLKWGKARVACTWKTLNIFQMLWINHWFNISTKLINLKTTNARHTITKEWEELLLRLLISCMMIEDNKNKSPLLMLICLTDNNWSNNSSILIFQSAQTSSNLKTEFSSTEYYSLR